MISVDIIPQQIPGGGVGLAGANLVRPNDGDILGAGADAVLPYLITFIAGWAAEKFINPNALLESGHHHSDGEMIRRYATGAMCKPTSQNGMIVIPAEERDANEERIGDLLDQAQTAAEEFVVKYRPAIEAVANALTRTGVLSPAEVEQVIADTSRVSE